MQEIWKDIPGFEGLYQVSNFGRVKSLNYNKRKIEKCLSIKRSFVYDIVCLSKHGLSKYLLVHRLVAEAFIPNPDNKEQVNHKDGNKRNNKVDNLEWATCKENILHSVKELQNNPGNWSRKPVRCIETGEIFNSQTAAAKAYNTHQGAVGNSARTKHYSAGGFHWEFV